MFIPLAINWDNLHALLRGVYDDMMPLCADMVGLAKGVAGLGALFYIAYRVWRSLASTEPIDVFPLLRPFAIGICIMFFPTLVIGTMNTVLSPITRSCSNIADRQIAEAKVLETQKDALERESMMRDPTQAYLIDDEEYERQLSELGILDVPQILWMMTKRVGYAVKEMVIDAFR